MPSTLALTIALLTALTIWLTLLVSEPVHAYVQPSSLHASWMPYWVGTKNGFVVTWLTKVNLKLSVVPKIELAPLLELALEPQALSRCSDRAGGRAGQGRAAQERAPVEPRPVGLLVVVVQTLYRFVSVVLIRHLASSSRTDSGACRSTQCAVGHYLLASPDRRQAQRERENRRSAAEYAASPSTKPASRHERRVRLWPPHLLALALAVYLRNMSDGRERPLPSPSERSSPTVGRRRRMDIQRGRSATARCCSRAAPKRTAER